MKGERIAVIDLGSNTFHLLICEIDDQGSWSEIHKEREYVKLASGGLNSIDANSEQRALDAMIRFMNLISAYDVRRTRAIGTAALREAENGPALAKKLEAITGIEIEIIDGQEEAILILKGIQSILPNLGKDGLIMDIGGGSVEFILYKGDQVSFTGSFKIGVAVLYREFHLGDPISQNEIARLERFLKDELASMINVLKETGGYYLIGASGSFDVIFEALPVRNSGPHWAELDISGILKNLNTVIGATLEERKKMPEIPEERLDYIVVAYILIRYLILAAPPEKLYYSEFALKEGVAAEMIDSK